MDLMVQFDELEQLIAQVAGRARVLRRRIKQSTAEARAAQEQQALRHLELALFRMRMLRDAMATDKPKGLIH